MSTSKKLCPNSMDRISELPDSVLIHILSLMPTIYAVRTSKLARRWRYLWKSLHNLDFSMQDIKDVLFPDKNVKAYYTRFDKKGNNKDREIRKLIHGKVIRFVDGVLLLHDTSNIETFIISCSPGFDYLIDAYVYALDFWISAVVLRNVQEIRLSLSFWEAFHLPPCLFTCDTLTTLNLDMRKLELPCRIQLANLKKMRVTSAKFSNETSAHRLFSCSPVLDGLYIWGCSFLDTSATLDIISDSLKKLVLGWTSGSILFPCAPKLECFIFQGFMLGSRRTSLPSLTKLRFTFCQVYEPDNTAIKPVMEILNSVCMSRYLELDGFCMKVLNKNFQVNASSPFHHLKQLEITVTSSKHSWELVIHLIETNLELNKLIVDLSGYTYNVKQTDAVEYEHLGSSPKENLQSIETSNVVGGYEVSFLIYLLKTQSRLKEMTVTMYGTSRECRERVSKELMHSPRLATGLALLVLG